MLDDGGSIAERLLPQEPRPPLAGEAPAAGAPAASQPLADGRWRELLAAALEAGALAERLLAAPRPERFGMIAADAAYRERRLARLLALTAEERLDGAPRATMEYAELALAVAVALPRPTSDDRRLRARCAWLLGKARLRAGWLAAAETNFAAIPRHLRGVTGAAEWALAAAGLAQLRWRQGRVPEAWPLFIEAARGFADLSDAAAVGACRALAGFLLLGSGELMLARLELRSAHKALGREAAPSLGVLICLGLAHCEPEVAGPAASDFFALAHEAARGSLTMTMALTLGPWWTAALGMGRNASDARLDAVRRRALARSDLGDAARATLERAMRLIATDDAESVVALAAPLAALPEGAPWGEEIAALAGLPASRSAVYLRAASHLGLRLAGQGLPSLAARRLPWGVCDLADRLLCQRREGEHPIGAARGL